MTDSEKLELLLLKMTDMQSDVSGLKTQMQEVRLDVGELKMEMQDVKTEISDMKADISGMKTEISDMKADISDVKTEMNQNNNFLLTEMERLHEIAIGRIAAVAQDVAKLKNSRNAVEFSGYIN